MTLDQIHEHKELIKKLGNYAKEYSKENIVRICIEKWRELDATEKTYDIPW